MPAKTRMVADVGGTNTRMALFDPATDDYRQLHTFINRDFEAFEDIVGQWLGDLTELPPSEGCIAVAAPPSPDLVSMVNMNWSFSCEKVASQFGLEQLGWINDFQGNAYSLPHLNTTDRDTLHAGRPNGPGVLATVGPGTGLGGATLEMNGAIPVARACEPGHMGLSPGSELEVELFGRLLPRFGNIYAELLVSGPGLQRLYETLGEIHGSPVDARSPAEISNRALAGNDALCVAALDCFCGLLGSTCGDFVLANGAYGGLYLAGGIIPRMIPLLTESRFHQRFCDKGAMGSHLQQVPVHIITNAQPGLIGAAHAPLKNRP